MTRYYIKLQQPEKHYIDFEARFETQGADKLRIQLPAWRPGRYELANFAQNIRKWKAFDEKGNFLKSYKTLKDCWLVETNGCQEVRVQYDYYAFQLDAGNSYYDENQLYINPVNCFLFIQERINEPCELTISDIPENYSIAGSLDFNEFGKTETIDFHTLADSPFIICRDIKSTEFMAGAYRFKISVIGNVEPDWTKIKDDFTAFSSKQIELFGELPVNAYHFLYQMPDYKYYHGVEHQASTVICIGPAENLNKEEFYNEFLGISSHELFHCWNVKSIRPAEMYPYDYRKENYSVLNYVTEGVTTYYGDLMLLRSGGFSPEVFFARTAKTIERHEHNFGKLFQTLAEASLDAWLDGYKPGVPERKISFYQKGMMVAWLLDLNIMMDTSNSENLDSVMKRLYQDFAKKSKGYTESDYIQIIESITGKKYHSFFEKYVWGLDSVVDPLNQAFEYIGCRIEEVQNPISSEFRLGFRLLESESIHKNRITHIAPGSPADIAELSIQDKILTVNGIEIDTNLEEVINSIPGISNFSIAFNRNGKIKTAILKESSERYYPLYQIVKNTESNDIQKQNYIAWSHQAF